MVLLMEEILHHLGCRKPVNDGISYLSTGAGYFPSTVACFLSGNAWNVAGAIMKYEQRSSYLMLFDVI